MYRKESARCTKSGRIYRRTASRYRAVFATSSLNLLEKTMSESITQSLDDLVARVKSAQQKFANFTQEQVDQIFRAASLAANQARIPLAQMAVEESGMGIVEDKVIKNHFASEFIFNKYKDEKL